MPSCLTMVQATASGLWRAPVVILQQLVLMHWTVPIPGLSRNLLSPKACLDTCKGHLAALTLLQPGECMPWKGDELQGTCEHLPTSSALIKSPNHSHTHSHSHLGPNQGARGED
jgi:hypothetical protein